MRALLDANTDPSLVGIAAPSLPGVTFPRFEVSYVNPNDNYEPARACTSAADCTGTVDGECSVDGFCRYSFPVTLTDGNIAGLGALQTPIQVVATADVATSTATVADIVQLNLILIFQFAIFFDGDLIFQKPAPMTIAGPTPHQRRPVPAQQRQLVGGVPMAHHRRRLPADLHVRRQRRLHDLIGRRDRARQRSHRGPLSHASDALHKASLETNHPDGIKDVTRNVEALELPINVPHDWDVEITSRPDRCVNNPYVAADQSGAIALVKRPHTTTISEYSTPYSTLAASGWSVPYGPTPTTDGRRPTCMRPPRASAAAAAAPTTPPRPTASALPPACRA